MLEFQKKYAVEFDDELVAVHKTTGNFKLENLIILGLLY